MPTARGCVPRFRTEEFQDQIRETVDNARLLLEAGRGIHHAENSDPREIRSRSPRCDASCPNRESGKAGGGIALLDRESRLAAKRTAKEPQNSAGRDRK